MLTSRQSRDRKMLDLLNTCYHRRGIVKHARLFVIVVMS
jgi:hypothetical protein